MTSIYTKLKFMNAEPYKNQKALMSGLMASPQTIEGNHCCANDKYFATIWNSAGGSIAVRPVEAFHRFVGTEPMLNVHKGAIQDMCFSPFHSSILATSSADTTIKISQIPEDGLQENLTEYIGDLQGHIKKVMLIRWHPTAEYTICSAAQDKTVKIWDIQKQSASMSYDNCGGDPWSIEWNLEGSMLATACKDKSIHLFDPRQLEQASVAKAHKGIKPMRLQWTLKGDKIVTVGANDFNERQYGVWDIRDMSKPLAMNKLDNQNMPMMMHFDPYCNSMYIVNRGSKLTQMFYYEDAGSKGVPELKPMDNYLAKSDPHLSMFFFPKRFTNCADKEINRAIRSTGKTAEFLSFKVMVKAWVPELFPDVPSGESATNFEEWASGKNPPPNLYTFDPDSVPAMTSSGSSFQKMTTMTKPRAETTVTKRPQEESKQVSAPFGNKSNGINLEDKNKIASLEKTVKSQQDRINELEATVSTLTAKLSSYESGTQASTQLVGQTPASNSDPKLVYWDVRGFGEAIRMQLTFLGVQFEDKVYEARQPWLDDKFNIGMDFPNLPYFEDNGFKMSETLAIHQYIADKWMPQLLGETPEERADVDMVSYIVKEIKMKIAMPCYQLEGTAEDMEGLANMAYEQISRITPRLEKQQYICGAKICYVDFFLYETLQFFDFITKGQIYLKYPCLQSYCEKMQELPELKDYSVAERPFNGKIANINNWPALKWEASRGNGEFNPYN